MHVLNCPCTAAPCRTRTQEGFQQLLSDHRFNRALAALRLLVRHHLPLLVKQLGAWRQTTHANLQRMPEKTERDRMIVFTKRVRGRYAMSAANLRARRWPQPAHMHVRMGRAGAAPLHAARIIAALPAGKGAYVCVCLWQHLWG
jgi:hypothetical protein